MLALATRAGTTRVDSYEEFASASAMNRPLLNGLNVTYRYRTIPPCFPYFPTRPDVTGRKSLDAVWTKSGFKSGHETLHPTPDRDDPIHEVEAITRKVQSLITIQSKD